MGTLYENISTLCAIKKIKPGKMCVDIGVSKSMMTKLHDDPNRKITSKTAQKIADYFGVSVDRVLTGRDEKNDPGPKTEVEKKRMYAKNIIDLLDDEDLQAVSSVLERLQDKYKPR